MNTTSSSQKFVRALKIRFSEYTVGHRHGQVFNKHALLEPVKACFHPIKELTALKSGTRGSVAVATAVWLLFFLMSVLDYFKTGFLFNLNLPKDFNVLFKFGTTAAVILVFCIVNWALCTLLDGKGTFREIWITVCYGITPKLLFGLPLILISNVLCLEESAIFTLLQFIINVWCVILVFTGLLIIHEYSFSKTVFSCVLTALGIVVLVYLLLLFVSMLQQLYAFIITVLKEALSRK